MAGSSTTSEATELPDFDALWDYDDPSATEQRFRALLPAAEAGDDRDYHAQLLTQIGRTQGLQRDFEGAHRTLDEVQAMLAAGATVARARYLLERGRAYNSSGSPDKARPLFLEALATALAVGDGADYFAVDGAHMMAIIEPPAESMEWNLRAVQMAESSPSERARKWLGSLYNNIGWTLHDQGKYGEALAAFEQALVYRRSQGELKGTRIARWCVARALRSLGMLQEALEMQIALATEAEPLGEENGEGNEEIAECLLALGQSEAARPHARKAYDALSKDPWLAANEPARLARLRDMAT